MKKLISFCLLLFFSCHSAPKNILPPSQMKSVLWDVMQADEMADYYAAKDSSFKTMIKHVAYYEAIFSIHKTNKETFVKSLNYYEAHPEKLKTILDSLQSFAEKMQKNDTLKKHRLDSAKKKATLP